MIKFAIWGIGKLGKIVFKMLKKENILGIIDKSEQWLGKRYCGIDVLQPKAFFEEYPFEVPIIVTPRKEEQEIERILKEKGKKLYFLFSQNQVMMEGFLLQAPIENMIRGYSINNSIIIYGISLLGLIMYNYFIRKGFNVYLCVQSNYDKKNLRKLQVKLVEISEVSSPSTILLAMEMSGNDSKLLLERKIECEPYYDLGVKETLYHNLKLVKFKNIHKNKRCFIVATGPSLKVEDINKLKKNHEICISMNGIFKIYPMTEWRPDYYIISDASSIMQWEKQILEMDVKAKFIADVAWVFEQDINEDNIYKWHFQREWKENNKPKFSSDFSRVSYMGWTVTYDGALQLAAYMGFTEIYLLGVDCCQYELPEMQHFSADYVDKDSRNGSILQVDKNILAYEAANEYANSHGIKIYNATRGGKLEVFERVDFDSLFEKK